MTKRDRPDITFSKDGKTMHVSNPDLIKRLQTYMKNSKGKKFTLPEEGKPTGNRARANRNASAYADKMRKRSGGSPKSRQVSGGLNQSRGRKRNTVTYASKREPTRKYNPSREPAQRTRPSSRPTYGSSDRQAARRYSSPQAPYIGRGGPYASSASMAPPVAQPSRYQYLAEPSVSLEDYMGPQMDVGEIRGYQPPRPMSTLGDAGGLHPLSMNPWARPW